MVGRRSGRARHVGRLHGKATILMAPALSRAGGLLLALPVRAFGAKLFTTKVASLGQSVDNLLTRPTLWVHA